MKYLNGYINTLLAEGKFFFTKQEAMSRLELNPNQFRFQAYRLLKRKAIRRLVHDFFMIIPAEYYHLGSLPPNWIIDPLMKYLKQDYYIGLLSAAALYGATEQQPMVFQVITNKVTKSIHLERGFIEFHVLKNCSLSTTSFITVSTGYVKVSSREQTIIDLVKFYKVSGYLSTVALVIKTIAEEGDLSKLDIVIAQEKTNSVLQRLGYILENVGFPQLADIIDLELKKRSIQYVYLRPDFHKKEGFKDKRWKLVINDSLELI
jgi:predicted transcriptional regulator of viral defense system